MLVLSRKKDQRICFPDLGITVKIVNVNGSKVRLGVDAPAEVRIVREELMADGSSQPPRSEVIRLPQQFRHELRNQLNSLSIALHLFQQEVAAGRLEDAEATFDRLVERLRQLDQSPALSHEGVPASEPRESTALLVEDEANEREMLAGFLRLHGYQVASAADGEEALAYLESNEQPSVVLVDMRMPNCDGPTTIRRIRANPAFDATKIFAISGSTPEENHINAEDEGVNGWFMKPLNPQHLVDAMMVTSDYPETTIA